MTNHNSICLGLTSDLELNIGSWETIETADESLGVSTPWALIIHVRLYMRFQRTTIVAIIMIICKVIVIN